MTPDDQSGMPRVRYGPIQWLTDPVRTAIEGTVSQYSERVWRIVHERDFSEFACHHCAIVSDSSLAAFFKYSEALEAQRQFEIELGGLRTLSRLAGVPVPQPIGIAPVEGGTILVMKALDVIARGLPQWRDMGATLARIHRVKGHSCGLETDGYWGPLHQDNTPARSWASFFAERRLKPLLRTAIDSGNIPASVASDVEKLIPRLPELCGPEVIPTLLHGDAQQNNFICTAEGTFVIDPAVHYGNPEFDLALIDAFQPAPDDVFDSYREEMPIDSGFSERRDLWRIPLYLAAVALEGPMNLSRLTRALQKYV
jgi:protein-ribulosamine 3-kinase